MAAMMLSWLPVPTLEHVTNCHTILVAIFLLIKVWADHLFHVCYHHNTTVVYFLIQGQLTYNKSNERNIFCNEIPTENQKK
jgi:hypothetical protein